MAAIEIGRLLKTDVSGCVVGCWVSQISVPRFGGLVRIKVSDEYYIYGLMVDIKVEDDGLVRQLLSADQLGEDVVQDNRMNRNVPVEITVLFVGYEESGEIYHLLPPRPPLILDAMYTCTTTQITAFTSKGRFGYLRHVLRSEDLPVGELLSAHLKQASEAQEEAGREEWGREAAQEIIILLRDDYGRLMQVLGSLADARITGLV
jgi:hypothetical protein